MPHTPPDHTLEGSRFKNRAAAANSTNVGVRNSNESAAANPLISATLKGDEKERQGNDVPASHE